MKHDEMYETHNFMERYFLDDEQAAGRWKLLQKRQLQEEFNNKRRKRQERIRKQKLKRRRIVYTALLLCIGILAFIFGRISGYKKYKEEKKSAIFSVGQSQAKELANTDSVKAEELPFLRTYVAKYPESEPKNMSKEEIKEKIHAMAQVDTDFQTIENNIEQYPDTLLNNLCNNPNMISYALSYNEKCGTTGGEIENSELDGIPLFIQWDSRWGYAPYGNDVIGLSGCGPTCMSMVVVGLTGNKEATPIQLADYATEHGYYEDGAGTKWSFMEDVGNAYGLQGTYLPLQKELLYTELEQGHPIICSMRQGDFTAEGHYVVIAGIENGKLRIHDPNSMTRSEKLWEYEDIESQIANLWSYSVAE